MFKQCRNALIAVNLTNKQRSARRNYLNKIRQCEMLLTQNCILPQFNLGGIFELFNCI